MGHLETRQLARKRFDMKLLVTTLALVLLFVSATSKPLKEERSVTGYAYPEPGEHAYHEHEFLAPDLSSIKEVEAVGFTHHGSGVIDDDDHHSRTSQAGFLFEGARKFPYYGYQLDYGYQHQTMNYPLATRGAHVHHPHFGTDLIGLHASFPGVFAGGRVPFDDLRATPFGESYYGVQWYGARTPDTELSYSGFLEEGTGPVHPGRAHYPLYGSHEGLHSSYPGFAPGIMAYDRVELNSFGDKYNTDIIGGGYGPNGGIEVSKNHFIHKRSAGGFGTTWNTFSNSMVESSFGELTSGYKAEETLLEGAYGGKGLGWTDAAELGARGGEGLGWGHYGNEDLLGIKKEIIKVPKVHKVTIERPYPVDQPKPVDRPYPVEVKTPVDRLYPYEVQKPYSEPVRYPVKVEIPISEPYPVVVPKPVEHPYPVVVEKQVPISEPYPFKVRVPVEQSYSVEVKVPVMERFPVTFEVPVDKPYPVYIEKEVPVPEPYPVRVKVPVPVYIPKPYPVQVKVPVNEPYPVEIRVPIPDPYPVTVEKDVPIPEPYPVEKRIPVEEPYPVEVDVPVNHPYAVPVPKPYPVEKTISVPEPYPVPKLVPYSVEKTIAVSRDKPYPVPFAKPYPVPIKMGKDKF